MHLLAAALVAVLALVGALHAIWALRIWWPLGDETAMAHAVLGTPGVDRMPGAAITWAVVALTVLAMLWVGALAGWIGLPLPDWMITFGGWAMAAILLLRGAGAYAARAFGMKWEAPFHQLDAWLYSPLVLALAAGVIALLRIAP